MRISALGASGAPKRHDYRLDPADVLIKVKLVRWHDFSYRPEARSCDLPITSEAKRGRNLLDSPTGLLFVCCAAWKRSRA
jgi:hypothetical protein